MLMVWVDVSWEQRDERLDFQAQMKNFTPGISALSIIEPVHCQGGWTAT